MQPHSSSLLDLTGKVAIVTGASRGIGSAIASAYAAAGARLVLASRKLEGLEAVADLIRGSCGGEVLAVACHTGKASDVEALVARAREAFGGVDVLVNNAATSPHFGPLLEASETQWDKTFEVNVKGYVHTIRACVPLMRERGGGRIINVASVAGMVPHSGLGVYGVTKAAVLCSPGPSPSSWRRTSGSTPSRRASSRPSSARRCGPRPSSTRRPCARSPCTGSGQTDDLVGAALYLASDASGFVTGSVMIVDGGQTLGGAY